VELVAGGVTGTCGKVVGAVFSMGSPFSNLESPPTKLPFIATLDNKMRTTNIVPNVQVLLSKKSPVFLTPPTIWVPPPPKEDDNPPPLGFCTMITNINKRQTKRISTRNIVNVVFIKL